MNICDDVVSVTRGPDHIQVYNRVFTLANSTDSDETPHIAASHLGLRGICSFFACIQHVPEARTVNFRLVTPPLRYPQHIS